MLVLALDGSGSSMSVALCDDNKVLGDYYINNKKTHSQTLLPAVKDLLELLEVKVSDLDYIAVTNGPGSFTGLRICASTAKGLALATNIPIVPVATTEVLAYNYQGSDKLICPVMDARRGQVYTGLYEFVADAEGLKKNRNKLTVKCDATALDLLEMLNKINELGREVIFLGDAINVYDKVIDQNIKVPYSYAPEHMSLQKGGSLLAAAREKISAGLVKSAMDYVPEYYRLSQAERERLEKGLKVE